MLDNEDIEQQLRDMVIEISAVLYKYGIKRTSIGAMMRLVGLDSSLAKKYDDQWFEFDSGLQIMYRELKERSSPPPPGTILH